MQLGVAVLATGGVEDFLLSSLTPPTICEIISRGEIMAIRRVENTKELRVAKQISNLVNDLTLDLDQVGIYLATNSAITYRRVIEIADAAQYEKEERIHDDNNFLF